MLNVMTVVGTRPEIIRLSRLIEKLDRFTDHTASAWVLSAPMWLYRALMLAWALWLAVSAESRAQVDQVHAAALAAGGRDEGKPGLRTHYHPNYYGAYIRDPDGNKVCIVCHKAP